MNNQITMISKLIALSDHLQLPPDSFSRLSPSFEDRCRIIYQSADGNDRTFLVLEEHEVQERDLVDFKHELSKGFRIIELIDIREDKQGGYEQ
tara:strand:- start:12401 stop:12679 length:279 start_codon:yes stop_codon:yes gene_type:complete